MWAATFKAIMRHEWRLSLFHIPFLTKPGKRYSSLENLPSWVLTSLRTDDSFLCSSNGAPAHEWVRWGGSGDIGVTPELVDELLVEGVWLETLGPAADQIVLLHDFLHKRCDLRLLFMQNDMNEKNGIDWLVRKCSLTNARIASSTLISYESANSKRRGGSSNMNTV